MAKENSSLLPGAMKSKAPRKRQRKQILTQLEFWIMFLIPFVVFLITFAIFEFGYYGHSTFAKTFGVTAFVVSAVLAGPLRENHPRNMILGSLSAVAVLAGAVIGIYAYDTYQIFVSFYGNSRTYTNVVPSEPSASRSDAGKITFTAETHVDGTKSVGFAGPGGIPYCAAPIADNVETPRIEFWAVGMDCCGWEGTFHCDQAKNRDAHAGIVVFDNLGIFAESRKDWYDKAREKAEAEFDLVSVVDPLYVRFVTEGELNMLTDEYKHHARVTFFTGNLFYLALSFVFSFVVASNTPQGA